MRTLASIQKIIDLQPIPNADAIEVATVLGWHVVVKKGEFKIGDLCVYCEIDSVLPPWKEFAFLQPKFRVKTVRLRGQISQGICFSLTILGRTEPDGVAYFPSEDLVEGFDVTELIGVKKYELPVNDQLAGKVRGNFPGFLVKTDETRLQAFPGLLERWKDIPFFVTEKVDGSSCTFVIKNDEFHVASRNWDLIEEPNNMIWKIAREMKIEENLRSLGEERFALQGELIGQKIQNNRLGIDGKTLLFFNVYDFLKGKYMGIEMIDFLKLHHLPMVPVIKEGFQLLPTVDEMVAYATRKSKLNPEVWAEGIVLRPFVEHQDEKLGRLSFKVINPEYLLKYNE